MTDTNLRVSNIGDISEAHYTLGVKDMKFGFSFDRTQKLVFSGEVDPSTRRFNIPKHLLRRLIINALVFVPLLLISVYLEQPFGFWFTLFWGGGITLWQIVA